MSVSKSESILPDFNDAAARRYRNYRMLKDVVIRYLMAVGGISVIGAIVMIALYLVWVVIPLFLPARMEQLAAYTVPGGTDQETLYYALEEQHEVGMRVTREGNLMFFHTANGEIINTQSVLADSQRIVSFAAGDPAQHLLVFGLDNGTVLLRGHQYTVTYPDDKRLITPTLYSLFDGSPVSLDPASKPLVLVAGQTDSTQTTVAAVTEDNRLVLVNLAVQAGFLGAGETIERTETEIPVNYNTGITHLVIDVEQRELYVADDRGWLYSYDISDKSAPQLLERVRVSNNNNGITTLGFLSGGISLVVGKSDGTISQWFPVRDADNNYTLQNVRNFESQEASITSIVPEYYRKGLLALDAAGNLGIYHATAHRTVKLEQLNTGPNGKLAIAPRANAMLIEGDQGTLQFWDLENRHPEVSWSSLWGKVWYESRGQPEYIWQSSSASSDFEPKFSLTPLAFGTLKASFYAMLFAIPLAIMGAIYTAYFMSPGMRNIVKPTIEIMAALPTVILGFLAGLWFAPLVEAYLTAMFLMFLMVPTAVLLTAWVWGRLPESFRLRVPSGSEAIILIPVIMLVTILVFSSSKSLELWLFGGNLPLWMSQEWGITYDQRNSFVVGIAIGFAVIPTIFSISEDAIFGVPKHLTTGSLALGATPWQTMARVILLTASPGIFSAVMIGLGRAVGETMIVVMATGNTAIMDLNMFQGFRALSANIATEMPESELGSTHYRILFLAGLVLFLATFMFNTVAEVVRQRLRQKYSSL
jgi:phosphate transport system permease protein